MSNIKEYRKVAETTAECVEILNSYKESKWKRKSKFNLKVSSYVGTTHTVRVFSDGIEFVTLITTEDNTLLCKKMDLSEHKLTIDKVNDLAKYYYTHDYENVWYDPYARKLWVTGGDGGICYSEDAPRVVAQRMNDGNCDWQEEVPEFHTRIEELNDSTFEAECDPDVEEEGEERHNYILIGHINDIGNIECDDDDGETQGMTRDAIAKTPKVKSIAELKQMLASAVRDERFEEAAELKKKIDKLEKE